MSSESPLKTPLAELSEATVESRLPDFSLTSRNAVMAYYGALELVAEGINPDSERVFLTPKRLESLDPEEWIILSLDVDIHSATELDYAISTHSLTEELYQPLGLSRYAKGKRDHSVTNVGRKSSTSGVEHAAAYLYERVADWPTRDPVTAVADRHEDGEIIEKLAELSAQISEQEVEDALSEVYDGDQHVIATVRVGLDASSLSEKPSEENDAYHFPTLDREPLDTGSAAEQTGEYYFPGEIPILVAAAANRNRSKLATKNIDGSSRGDGRCSIENVDGEVIGAIEDPLGLYGLQHADELYGFDETVSWRHNPVAARNGPRIARSDSILEACYWSVGGLRIYALPYFAGRQSYRSAVVTHECLRRLQDADWDPHQDAENQVAKIQSYVTETFDNLADRLRFYFITLRTDSSGVRVFYEEPSVSALPVWDAAETYDTVRKSILGPQSGFTATEQWPLLEPPGAITTTGIADKILSRIYVLETLLEPYPNASDYKDATTDPREEVSYAVLAGDTVEAEWLLSEFLRLLDHERQENDAEISLRHQKIKQQFVQYQSLAAVGGLTHNSADSTLIMPPTTVTTQQTQRTAVATDGGDERGYVEVLNQQLDTFIEEHPVLAESTERQAAFVAGVFVSMVSKHQREERNISRTFMDRYDMSEVTPSQLMELLPEVLSKDQIYAREQDSGSTTVAPGIRDRLPEQLGGAEPTEWQITPVQFRYFYSLGTAYGEDASYAAGRQMNSDSNE